MPDVEANKIIVSVQKKVMQIWLRARTNAFAHRVASDEYKQKAERYFRRQVISGIFGILFVLAAYISSNIITQYTFLVHFQLPLIFTIASVLCAAYSLFESIIQNYEGYEVLFQIHNHNQHSYLYLAQRAREIEWPDINQEKAIAILEDLERDFQVLKVRGHEPSDYQFRLANKLISELRAGGISEMQSFGGANAKG